MLVLSLPGYALAVQRVLSYVLLFVPLWHVLHLYTLHLDQVLHLTAGVRWERICDTLF